MLSLQSRLHLNLIFTVLIFEMIWVCEIISAVIILVTGQKEVNHFLKKL
ncbi:hypothetical protein SRABI96_04388 [Peribacillus sp. Bi96]|nr:hypothetical protein SRABI96_04388 [Peribacillus sp. Bi96]